MISYRMEQKLLTMLVARLFVLTLVFFLPLYSFSNDFHIFTFRDCLVVILKVLEYFAIAAIQWYDSVPS